MPRRKPKPKFNWIPLTNHVEKKVTDRFSSFSFPHDDQSRTESNRPPNNQRRESETNIIMAFLQQPHWHRSLQHLSNQRQSSISTDQRGQQSNPINDLHCLLLQLDDQSPIRIDDNTYLNR